MPVVYLKLIMVVLVILLGLIVYMGLRSMRGLPVLRLPSMRGWFVMPRFSGRKRAADFEDVDQVSPRARQLAVSRKEAHVSVVGAGGSETPVEETMRSLEQAFKSFESGRISTDTYRTLLLAEKRAAVRCRAGVAARDDAQIYKAELSQAAAAVEAVEWCLNWINEYEQLHASAKSLFSPPELTPMAYS